MRYVSTRDSSINITAAGAIARGLSSDGGLYTPSNLPKISTNDISRLCTTDYAGRAKTIMKLFLDEFTEAELEAYAKAAYGPDNFDHPGVAPLFKLKDRLYFLELWHGPTSAFKDMALQILPHLLTASLRKTGETKKVRILVATSGDTGKAALEGFRDVGGTEILVFYPRDGVSEMQKLQMTTQEGKNVGVCAVEGNFDDAQSGVKEIFSDVSLKQKLEDQNVFLSSANSINWGRLLPQIVYYISAYCDLINSGGIIPGESINFCVPTGNFGNILAGYLALRMGLPIHKLICASNANNVLTDFFSTGIYDRNRALIASASPSMDILISSNLERLLYYMSDGDSRAVRFYMNSLAKDGRYRIDGELVARLSTVFAAGYCDDDETKQEINSVFRSHGYLIDTHTAVASKVLSQYRKDRGDNSPCVIVSTASPYKFSGSVLSALGEMKAALSGFEQMDWLYKITGAPIPEKLNEIRTKAVRFNRTVKKEDMKKAVMDLSRLF